ncbi:hypothetical protein J6590_078079 [Homalodisca vitripennis]|nr:hypothetical protein J6590_078079 [Homalodisca vitripennis]
MKMRIVCSTDEQNNDRSAGKAEPETVRTRTHRAAVTEQQLSAEWYRDKWALAGHAHYNRAVLLVEVLAEVPVVVLEV